MKLINIGILIATFIIIISCVKNISTTKLKVKNNAHLKDKNNSNQKNTNDHNNNKLNDNMEKHINTNRRKIKLKIKLSKELADAKKKCWTGLHVSGKIINGSNAENDLLPWMVAIYHRMKTTYIVNCGAALISESFVLTAAHCLYTEFNEKLYPKDVRVRLGTHDLSSNKYIQRDIVKFLIHPEYLKNIKQEYSDIAVIKLKHKVKYSEVLLPICIPKLTTPPFWSTLKHVKAVLIAGWGSPYPANVVGDWPTKLQKGYSLIVKPSVCAKPFRNYNYSQSTTICLANKHMQTHCKGDSGSPVVPVVHLSGKNNMVFPAVIGVTVMVASFCHGPSILTKVESFVVWINECTSK